MSADLLQLLFETVLAASAATALVLGLRLPVRRRLGARAAYALWLLTPVAIVAVLLPSPRVEPAMMLSAARTAATAVQATPVAQAARVDLSAGIAAAWALGAIVLAIALGLRQWRFRRALGRLRRQPDGSWRAESAYAGPAVIGALRGRVVLPADFDQRYTPVQRELVLRHERVHIARFDLTANLLANLLRCLHWFNPLLHYAFGRFRFDQELAADALVLAQRPDARRDYAAAMLAASLPCDPPPLGCHWQPAHPLKERIMMLKQPLPGAMRHAFGAVLAIGLALATGYAAWASQPARAGEAILDESSPALRVTLSLGGQPVLVHDSLVEAGAENSIVQDSEGLAFEYTVTTLTQETMRVSGKILRAGKQIAAPIVEFRRGTPARITISAPESGLAQDVDVELFYGSGADLRAAPHAQLQGEKDLVGATYARLSPPAYPEAAKAAKAEGTVILRVQVALDGKPAQIDVERSSGDERLDASARDKVAEWRFNPARRDGQAVESWVLVPVTFSLAEAAADVPPAAIPAGALDEIQIRPNAKG